MNREYDAFCIVNKFSAGRICAVRIKIRPNVTFAKKSNFLLQQLQLKHWTTFFLWDSITFAIWNRSEPIGK